LSFVVVGKLCETPCTLWFLKSKVGRQKEGTRSEGKWKSVDGVLSSWFVVLSFVLVGKLCETLRTLWLLKIINSEAITKINAVQLRVTLWFLEVGSPKLACYFIL
jgi:hypothetical protein